MYMTRAQLVLALLQTASLFEQPSVPIPLLQASEPLFTVPIWNQEDPKLASDWSVGREACERLIASLPQLERPAPHLAYANLGPGRILFQFEKSIFEGVKHAEAHPALAA
jgi:hypothetical protein